MRILGIVLLFIALVVGFLFLFRNRLIAQLFRPRVEPTSSTLVTTAITGTSPSESSIIASNLTIPWEVVFLPDDTILVTERSGNVVRIDTSTHLVQTIPGVKHVGEGGLLGMALHPDFKKNGWVYLYLTTSGRNGLINQVERYKLQNNTLTDRKIIIGNIPGSSNHDGGRIAFGPDNYLYITTGDAENPNAAQDTSTLNGKILRITDEGTIPADNPFGNAVYSYGHRNPQSLAWDNQKRLWETEHGPSGTQTGNDEVNLIEKGKNYGWPVIRGTETHEGMVSPVIESGRSDTWAPAGMAIVGNDIYFSGLRGEALYKAHINTDSSLTLTRLLEGKYGRLRAVTLGPDGNLYISTSNTDGRGNAREEDDKIIKMPL